MRYQHFKRYSFYQYARCPIVYQLMSSFTGSLPVFMAGIVLGWPSPVIEYMMVGLAPVTLTFSETSWMIAFIDIGNFLATVPVGRLMDWIGRKSLLTASGPLMIVGWMFILFGHQVRTELALYN